MILGLKKELMIFLQAILTGNFICLLYEGICLLRKIIVHKGFWVSVEDLLYWGFVTGYLFLYIQKSSSGNIRWYMVMGILGGVVVTHYFLRKFLGKYIDKTDKTE